jgi:glycerate 2-kinase
MKILIAPDSFKESLGAFEVATALAAGMAPLMPDAIFELVPMADGGEGTVAALVAATHGQTIAVEVTGPLGDRVTAQYGLLGDGHTAVLEMAAASGLGLVPLTRRNPLTTTSYGTGELIRHALAQNIETLIIGLGGSATIDGGAGLCQALGVRFLDRLDCEISHAMTGSDLTNVVRVDFTGLDPRLAKIHIQVACDVDNPLLGPLGAAAIFGPQKGATQAQVVELEQALATFYKVVEATLHISVRDTPGAGAAGGIGAALLAFLHPTLRPGAAIVSEAAGLAQKMAGADLVITGEGQLDAQTLYGKAPYAVARLARELGIPVIAVGGSLAAQSEVALAQIFDAVEACVTFPTTTQHALADATLNLQRAGYRIAQWLKLATCLNRT